MICNALEMVIVRRDDNLCRMLIRELLDVLLEKHQNVALKYVMFVLLEISNKYKNMNMT